METKKEIHFIGKIRITAIIKVLTGLHIGGSKTALDIGGIDLNVIKTARGEIPFIPGSSLKGKLRSLLAREEGSNSVNKDSPTLKELFGYSAGGDASSEEDKGEKKKDDMLVTRLIVRDADLDTQAFAKTFTDREVLETEFTEAKWENTIDRLTGTAKHPRQLERVPAEARFNMEMIYDMYDDQKTDKHLKLLIKAMRLIMDDYLGGHGSRGYGKIHFEEVDFKQKLITDYENEEIVDWQPIPNNPYNSYFS